MWVLNNISRVMSAVLFFFYFGAIYADIGESRPAWTIEWDMLLTLTAIFWGAWWLGYDCRRTRDRK